MAEIFKKRYILGLDVGTSAIKLAQFRKKDGTLRLVKARVMEIPRGKEPASVLREILSGIDIKSSRIVSIINSPQAMVRRVTAPQMPKSELKEAVSLEAKNYFPFSISDSLVDFEVVGDIVEKGIKKLELMVAVCPKDAVRDHLALLNQAGVRSPWLIPPSLALYNLLKFKSPKGDETLVGVDIGNKFCELVMIKEAKLIFTRKIPVSADDFTKAMAVTLVSDSGRVRLSYEEAEKIKRDYGIPEEASQELVADKIVATRLYSVLRSPAERLSREIAQSFNFYREEASAGRIDRLILFGGGARLKGLDIFLSKELGLVVEVYNSLEGIYVEGKTLDKNIEASRIACAVGAGINKEAGINLLPAEIREKKKKKIGKAVLKITSAAALTLLVLAFIGMRIQLATLDKKISGARLELSALKKQSEEAQGLLLTNKILKNEPYYEDILKEISSIVPYDIYLTQIRFQKELLTIKGANLSLNNPEEALSGFINKLEAGIFKNARLVITQEKEGVNEFEVSMDTE